MKLLVTGIIFFEALVCGCANNKVQPPLQDSVAVEKKDYFPVLDFLKGEIAYVDSFPLRIIKYTISGSHKDSSIIQSTAFDDLAKKFLSPELEKAAFEKEFKESSFLDQTSQSLSFTYSTQNNGLQIQRVDVLASPSLGFDKVKSIYLEKLSHSQDSTIIEKMYWRSRSNFQIIRILELPNHTSTSSQLKVVWDNKD
ncbi:MAG: hypothetical protein ACHQEM_09085 [Chitinophagales bacterium]